MMSVDVAVTAGSNGIHRSKNPIRNGEVPQRQSNVQRTGIVVRVSSLEIPIPSNLCVIISAPQQRFLLTDSIEFRILLLPCD